MSIVDNARMVDLSKKFKKSREVEKNICPFSKNCGTCMYNVYTQDNELDEICTRIRKGGIYYNE